MGVGYASIPGVPNAPNGSHMSEGGPPMASSEEWKDRGAAVSVRREVDAEGRTIMKSVKKNSFGCQIEHVHSLEVAL